MRLTRLPPFLRRALKPSFTDLLCASIIGWLFVAGRGWSTLLADGDTGWHIRTGQWILQHRAVPTTDLYSFTRAGASWFAWEWLSDVLMALIHARWGLAGVVVLAGCVIGLASVVLFRHMIWRGAHVLVALLVVLLAAGASSIHFLARPHVFTLLLVAVSLWMVERDRRRPSRAVWLLLPLSVLWINLHSGFFVLPACLAVLAAGLALEGGTGGSAGGTGGFACRPACRYALLSAATLGASLLNPYGFGLHRHVARFLTSNWIRSSVDEFQSPRFRSENLLQFELLLLSALLLAGWLLSRRRVADALLVVFWAHMALGSVRHVPVFVLVGGPLVAVELSRLWEAWAGRRSPQSAVRILWTLGTDVRPHFKRSSLWTPVLATAVILATPSARWPRDFPEEKFPVAMVSAELSRLSGSRVFTSDQWGDYLIYRGWPHQRVFIDGRSDFYGPAVGNDYLRLMGGRPGWENLLRDYNIGLALVPAGWPLRSLLAVVPGWRLVRADQLGSLYARALDQN